MAISLEEFSENLKQLIQILPQQVSDVVGEAAITASSMVKNRITEKGIGEKYSNKKAIPAYLLVGKDYKRANNIAKAKAFVKRKNKAKELTNWKEFREAQGLPTENVNLTYTGHMLRDTNELEVEIAGMKVLGRVGGMNRETKDKLKWNRERFGNYTDLTKEEKQIIGETIIKPKIIELINNIKL